MPSFYKDKLQFDEPSVDFSTSLVKHEVHSILAFHLTINNNVATTNITRRNIMHKYIRSIMGNPSQQGKKTQPNPLLYSSRERPPPPIRLSTRGCSNHRTLAPKRGVHSSQISLLAEISKLIWRIWFHNGESSFTYIRLVLSRKVSIGSTGLTSLSHIIININQINYLLHLLLVTLKWGRAIPFT